MVAAFEAGFHAWALRCFTIMKLEVYDVYELS